MPDYRITYDRVGRHGGRDSNPPAPLTVAADDLQQVAEHVAKDVRKYLGSPSYEIYIADEQMAGGILCGFRCGGTFSVELLGAEGGVSNG